MSDFVSIRIFIATIKPYRMPERAPYIPIQVGAMGKAGIGYERDDIGENISFKNAHYCELTALYWAWKHEQADFIGLCHYRRYFTRKEVHTIDGKWKEILSEADWLKLLAVNPVIVPDKRRYFIETNRSHYCHAHPEVGILECESIIRKKYPEYEKAFQVVMNRTWAHMFNMFVMRRDLFEAYMAWLFDILFELEKRIDMTGWDMYQQRIFGFVSEILFDVWLEANGIPYFEQNVSFMENQNWLKKGGLFLKRKFVGQ